VGVGGARGGLAAASGDARAVIVIKTLEELVEEFLRHAVVDPPVGVMVARDQAGNILTDDLLDGTRLGSLFCRERPEPGNPHPDQHEREEEGTCPS